MPLLKLAAVLESFNLALRPAIRLASTLGLHGIQVDAVGDLAPDNLTATGRREFRHLLRTHNLELSVLGCPLRYGFSHLEHLEARLAHVRKVLTLAYDLGPRRVVVYAGALPPADQPTLRTVFTESLTALGRYGEKVGSMLALAVGQEPPAELAGYLRGLKSGGLGVQIDPATLLMRRYDPVAAVREFQELIIHVHARDARPDRPDRGAEEVPLGHGDVDWITFLATLQEVGYQGWLTIRRSPTPDPARDLGQGIAFLRRLIS